MIQGYTESIRHTESRCLGRAQARPFLKWAGGKRTLIPEIERHLPPESINVYWEPFLGGGAVFFAFGSRISSAQISDINPELALTYQVVRNNPEELISQLNGHARQHSKRYYLRVRKVTGTPSSIEVAARFIYLNKTCFNGLYRVNKKGQFNVPMGSYKNPTICDEDNLRLASNALRKATIRLGDFSKITPGFGDFVYADPPYDGTFSGYDSSGFDESDHQRLRDAALRWHRSGASVMISNADTPFIQELYGQEPFHIDSVSAPRNINSNGKGRGAVPELLITTY